MTKLTVSTIVHAPLATVRDARNNPEHIVNRCFASDDRCCPKATNDLQVGGILCARMEAKDGSFGFDMTGKYDRIVPMTHISYTMSEMKEYFLDAGTTVDITFEDKGAEGVQITETFDAEDIHDLAMQTAGWQAILDNFTSYAQSIA